MKTDDTRVLVRDSINRERVLGTLPRLAIRDRGRYLRMAVMPKMPSILDKPEDIPVVVDFRTVDLRLDYTTYEDGWRQKLEYFTNAPLDDLMNVRDFQLPGENAEAAYRRTYYR